MFRRQLIAEDFDTFENLLAEGQAAAGLEEADLQLTMKREARSMIVLMGGLVVAASAALIGTGVVKIPEINSFQESVNYGPSSENGG